MPAEADRLIRIVLVEDDPRILESLMRVLEKRDDMSIRGSFGSGEAAMAATDWNEVDVLLSDLDLPGISGVDLITQARAANPVLLPLAYTIYEDRDTVFAALRAGAYGYLTKGSSGDELANAIRSLKDGGAPMSPGIARRLLEEFRQQSTTEVADGLSNREISLLRLLAEGLIYKEIGDRLSISPHTVHTHIKNIYGKLHAADRQQALRRARMLGYIDPR
jgi:two-component system NarL family response regulator